MKKKFFKKSFLLSASNHWELSLYIPFLFAVGKYNFPSNVIEETRPSTKATNYDKVVWNISDGMQ